MTDFLIIGAQKSATTWLHRMLQTHPEIDPPPVKELHHFDMPPLVPVSCIALAPNRSVRHWGRNRLQRHARRCRAGDLSASWFARYYFLPRTKGWYRSLFAPGPGRISGEATPRYAILDHDRIRQVKTTLPDAKIIYLLRDPIKRAWSDLAMFHSSRYGHDGLETIDEQRMSRFLTRKEQLEHSRYAANLSRWETFYGPSQILVGFHEQVRDDPRQLLDRICDFLGVARFEDPVAGRVTRRINAREYPDMPDRFARLLASHLIEDIERVDARFNNQYTADWLASARARLA